MEQIRVICNRCDIDMLEIVGTGMLGVEHLICICDECGLFAKREHSGPLDGKPRPKCRCGSCRKLLRVFAPVDNDYRDIKELKHRCPVCGGRITVIDYAIEMD